MLMVMVRRLFCVIAGLLFWLAECVYGSEVEVNEDQGQSIISPWSGSGGEMGFATAHGNSTTESLNGRLKLRYSTADDNWLHSMDVFGLRSRTTYTRIDSSGVSHRQKQTTAHRYSISLGSALRISERQQFTSTVRYERDDFAAFDRRQIFGLGYGGRLIDGQRMALDTQIGPGSRRAREAKTGVYSTDFIGRALFDLNIKLTGNTELTDTLLAESGPDNTFVQNDLGLAVTMNQHLALKINWQARSNSHVDDGKRNIDTLLTMNVVYQFK